MALWTKVASGFDSEDETVNFGTRAVAENDGSIYEAWTKAIIQPETLVINNPKVDAYFSNSMFYVAIDKSITIFADESCQDIITTIGFDCIITAYVPSSDGHILYVAVKDGGLHGIHLPMGCRKIFCIDFIEKFHCEYILQLFLQETKDINDLIIITKDGKVFKTQNLKHNSLDESINENQINFEIIADMSRISGVVSIDENNQSINQTSNEFSFIAYGTKLCLWPKKVSYSMENFKYRYKKIQFFNNYQSAIGLRTDGSLSLLCLQTLLGKKIWNGPVVDFVTVKEKSHGPHQMLVLMKPKENEDKTKLHLISFPELQIKFSISVESNTYLVDVINSSIDNIIFLEGIKNTSEFVDLIRIKAIEESIPELRLQRLLRRHQFVEAQDFAKKFNLDMENVFHSEAVVLMDRLRPRIHSMEKIDIDVFIKTLEKIQDIRFICECCNNAMTRDYKDTRKLLFYARQRIVDYINSRNPQESRKDNFTQLLGNVSDTLRKLETFEIIHKNSESDDSTDEWIKFSRANLLEECLLFLSQGELNSAALIWIRHTPSIAPKVTQESIIEILNSIPENLAPEELWPWLRHFIPSVTSFLPNGLSEIIQWGYKKTKSLEKFHRDSWPDVGLEFSQGLIDMLCFDEYNVCYQFHQQYANKNSQLQRLMMLVQAMSDLSELKSRYKVTLPLNTYLGNPTDVIHLLLNKVYIEGIPGLIEHFLQQYMLNHSLQNDQVLSSYIQKVLKNSKGWWLWEKAPWDKRLSLVINYIHNIQNRLQQTHEVLKKAPVPWSEAVLNLAEKSYNYDHPLVASIRMESSSVAVKLILKKYGFAQIGLCSNLFSYIIKQNRSTMIQDILDLTSTNPTSRLNVFSECIDYYLRQGDIDQAIIVLNQLQEDIVVHCCEHVINVLKSKLNCPSNKLYIDDTLVYYIEVLGTIESHLEKALKSTQKREVRWVDSLKAIPDLRAIYHLKKEFDADVKFRDFYTNKEKVLQNCIIKLIDSSENSESLVNLDNLYKEIHRITYLLGLPELQGVYQLSTVTNDPAILKNYILSRFHKNELILPEDSFYLNKICSDLVMEVENDQQMAQALKKLCSGNMAYCKANKLLSIFPCSSRVDAYNEAIGQIVKEDELQENLPGKQNSWNLYQIYKDASISSGNILLPLLRDLLNIWSHYQGIHEFNLQDSIHQSMVVKRLSQRMLENARSVQNEHHDLALFKIIAIIHVNLSSFLPVSEEVVTEIRSVLDHCIATMLKKSLGSSYFDIQLGLVCLLMVPDSDPLKSLGSAARLFQADYIRDRVIKDLGFEYCRLTGNYSQMEKFNSFRVLHQWAKRLVNYGISYREMLNSDTEMKRDILRRIMISNKPDVIVLLTDFGHSFGFEQYDLFLTYLSVLLTSWQPQIQINPSEGQKELKINENDVKNLALECHKVAAQITDKVALKTHLLKIMPKINFYHYEIFLIILDIGQEKSFETRSHLLFLQNYARVGIPSDDEREEWSNLTQENQSLPPISKWRLPFIPKMSQSKLIQAELNLKTYEKWLSIAPILKISEHTICTLAVKGAIGEAWKGLETNSNTWSIYPRNSSLLKDIKKCIGFMKGPEGHYYATAALYYVVNHTPPGADQVAAAKECYIYAKKWSQQCESPDPASDTKRQKIEEKYRKYTSKHILHTYGLGCEKYLNLIDYPEQLVRALYKDESIPQRYKSATKSRPDINSAVNDLATVLSLQLVKIKLELLHEWLQPETGDFKNDSITTAVYHDISVSADTFTTDDNLLRACYIIGSGDSDSYKSHLMNIGLEDKDDCHGPGVRFRALRVLQSVTDEATLKEYTKIDSKKFNNYMKSLQYLTDLQRLGIGYSVSGFEMCSKQKLVEVLLNSQFCTPRAIRLIPQIFVDFKIEDYKLLNLALEKMTQFSMVKELKKTLSMLGSMDRLVNCSGYIAAWQIVVSDSFNRLDTRSGPDSFEACTEALRLLHACPVVDKLQFREIINSCLRSKQMHLAAALLPFIEETDKQFILEAIQKDNQSKNVINSLSDLAKRGILIVPQSIIMIEQVNASKDIS